MLWEEGVADNVLNLTGPGVLYQTWQAQGSLPASQPLFDWLIPHEVES